MAAASSTDVEEGERVWLETWKEGKLAEHPIFRPSSSPSSPSTKLADPEPQAGLPMVARELVARLSVRQIEALKAYTRRPPITYNTICNGTGVAVHCHAALSDALGDPRLIFDRKFACEANADKRVFITHLHSSLKMMFKRSEELATKDALDVMSGDPGKMVPIPACHGTAAGYSCTDVSTLNKHSRSASNASCVASKSKRIGKVFDDVVRFLENHQEGSEWAILENVVTLATPPKQKRTGVILGPSNMTVCVHRLQN